MKTRFVPYITLCALAGCSLMAPKPKDNSDPSEDYTNRLKAQLALTPAAARSADAFESPSSVIGPQQHFETPRARFASDVVPVADGGPAGGIPTTNLSSGNLGSGEKPDFYEYHSEHVNSRDYNGPLALGDPGLGSSLWHDSAGDYDMFRDQRAFKPMDLITIVVSENSQGQKQAKSQVDQESDVSAGITNFLGLENSSGIKNSNITPSALVNATIKNDFQGQGTAQRQGTLTAQISAMVVEVLPSGILRIEGKKIVTMDGEQETMKITGLVRPRDITSANQVSSAQIADMRIDYFGQGTLGEAQSGGWMGRIMRNLWPF